MKGTPTVQIRRYARLLATICAAVILLGSGAAWATVRLAAKPGPAHRRVRRAARHPGQRRPADVPGGRLGQPRGSVRPASRLHTGWDVYGQRTDTMMLAHISRDGGVSVVSLPRDSLVTVPAHTDENGGAPARS